MNQTNAAYMMTMKHKPSYYMRDKAHSSITFENYVIRFSARAAWYAFLFGFCVIAFYFLFDFAQNGGVFYWAAVGGASVVCGGASAGFVGGAALFISRYDFPRLTTDREALEFEEETKHKEEEPDLMLVNETAVSQGRKPKTLKFEGHSFTFTGRNLTELKRRFDDGETAVRRETDKDRPPQWLGFDSLPDPIRDKTYTKANFVLNGTGFLVKKNRSTYWNDEGYKWLCEE